MKAAFHTLGCKVNQYETETIREQFQRGGFEIVDENTSADVYVVNTCTVTNLADRKSRQFIRRAKRLNPNAVIAVTGCYVQVNLHEAAKIDGVEIIAGTGEKSRIFQMVMEYLDHRDENKRCEVLPYEELDVYEHLDSIRGMEGRTRAYIKIEEGCDRFCSYCIIPYARGKVRSREPEEILKEVRYLVEQGCHEVVLTGINTALYGRDLGLSGISPLLSALDREPGNFRVRLSSLEPTVIDPEYVEDVLAHKRLCHHLHLSLQSGSDRILERMHRRYTRKDFLQIVKLIRDFDPLYGISTDIIVGFPGEEEEDFLDSVSILKEAEFCRTHVFKYSPRTGTPAAGMKRQVSGEKKRERSRILAREEKTVRNHFLSRNTGFTRQVLTEQDDDGMVTGYSDNYIKVYLPEGTPADQFFQVRLEKKYKDGMMGKIIASGKEEEFE